MLAARLSAAVPSCPFTRSRCVLMKKSFRRWLLFFFVPALAAALAALAWAGLVFFERQPPRVRLHLKGRHLGLQNMLHLSADDAGRGLRRLTLTMAQGGRRVVLLDEQLPRAGFLAGGARMRRSAACEVAPRQLGFANGPARLEVTARDYSLSHWGRGNAAVLSREVVIDLSPPVITVLGATRYLNQGGSGTVIYRISEPVSSQGVLAGTRFFSGTPVPGRQGVYQVLFALPHDTADLPLQAQAQDLAGNTAKARFRHEIKPKKFRRDVIALRDAFLRSLAAKAALYFPDYTDPASPLNTFLAANTVVRSRNEDEFRRICSQLSPRQLWQGAFMPLPNASARAVFGDRRSYLLDGKEISTSVHLGLDLASLDQAPVPAANAGRVAEIKHMGIYGLTLILDHGQGLFSTYSHLSAAEVKKGEAVRAGQIIARTGSTGLALGDHLHFGIAVQGVFVNPAEWIDANWIRQKVALPRAEAGLQ